MIETKLTAHALQRTDERLRLTPQEVRRILETESSVLIRYEPGTHKVHHLCYDPRGNYYFVAVIDERSKHIISVIPFTLESKAQSFHSKNKMKMLMKRAKTRVLSLGI